MQTNEEWLSKQIYSRYGDVKRARSCFLYTEKGVRLTDLYQCDSRAILGWEGGKARLALKNTIARGQTGSFFTHFSHQLEKAVCELFGKKLFVKICSKNQVQNFPRWRPWLSTCDDEQILNSSVFYFVPPFPFAFDYFILCSQTESELSSIEEVSLPVCFQAAFIRSLYDLKNEIPNRCETDFRFFDKSLLKYFERKGPYLFVRQEFSNPEFVLFCLENAVVISPDNENPSIIPFGADYGVFTSLIRSDFSDFQKSHCDGKSL